MSPNQSLTDQIVSLITSQILPEQIILFGSYARGENRDNSDMDILIVIKNLTNERKITGDLYKELLNNNISTPIDFIAVDYDKYNKLKNKNGYIYKTINKEGKILYGK